MDPRPFLAGDDDQRRSIERALHDSVQQRLIALAVELQLARSIAGEEVARRLDDARADVGRVLDDVRAIARQVHPALLDSQGLVAALRMAAAAAPRTTGVRGTIEADVPPEAAVTVYRICAAALAGVDGADSRTTVTVGARDGELDFAIEVAGGRIDAASLEVSAARIGLLGGVVEIAPTRVAGRLPLTSRHPPRDT